MKTPGNRTLELPPDVALADNEIARREVYRFRYEIYYRECHRETEGIDHARREIRDLDPDNSILLYVRKEGRVVGAVSMDIDADRASEAMARAFSFDRFAQFPPSTMCCVYKIMVAPAWRSTPVIGYLIKACYQIARAHGVRLAFCGASPHLVKLYEAMGFQRYKENIEVPGQGLQVPMVCLAEDIEYLRRVRSPFLKLARQWESGTETAEWFARTFPRTVGNTPERLVDPQVLWGHFRSRLGVPENGMFRGLDEASIRKIVSEGTYLTCRPGESLMHSGQVADDLMLVLGGRIGVPSDVARPGDVLGVRSFLSGEPRPCEATTLEYTEILSITPAALKRALRRTPAALGQARENLERMEQERLARAPGVGQSVAAESSTACHSVDSAVRSRAS